MIRVAEDTFGHVRKGMSVHVRPYPGAGTLTLKVIKIAHTTDGIKLLLQGHGWVHIDTHGVCDSFDSDVLVED